MDKIDVNYTDLSSIIRLSKHSRIKVIRLPIFSSLNKMATV